MSYQSDIFNRSIPGLHSIKPRIEKKRKVFDTLDFQRNKKIWTLAKESDIHKFYVGWAQRGYITENHRLIPKYKMIESRKELEYLQDETEAEVIPIIVSKNKETGQIAVSSRAQDLNHFELGEEIIELITRIFKKFDL